MEIKIVYRKNKKHLCVHVINMTRSECYFPFLFQKIGNVNAMPVTHNYEKNMKKEKGEKHLIVNCRQRPSRYFPKPWT